MLGLRGRMKRHITVILGVAALSLGVFAAPASSHAAGGFVDVLEVRLVYSTGENVTCRLDDDANWNNIDATDCAALGNIGGQSISVEMDPRDEGGCADELSDEIGEDGLIFIDVKIFLVEDDSHDPAVSLLRLHCAAGELDEGDTVTIRAAKDFSDNIALAVPFSISCTGTASAPVLVSDDSHAVDPASGVGGDNTVDWEVNSAGVAYFQYGVVATWDLDADDDGLNDGPGDHILVTLDVEGSMSGDLATNIAGLASASVPSVSASCSVTETVPAGYTANVSGCANKAVSAAGGTVNCTIVNTLTPAAPPAPAGGAAAGAGAASSGLPSFTG